MYFSIVPNISYDEKPISYPFSESDFVTAKNFFRRYKLNDDVFSSAVFFKKYAIEEGERPDTIAQKAYGNPFYDWIILLTNNMVNVKYDWPMSNYEIYKILESEYEDPYGTIHHYETNEIGQFAAGLRVDEQFYNSTHKINVDGTVVTKNGNEISRPVTIAEWFTAENEKKREIYLLKPNYLQPFVDDFRKQNKYKKSGNYINQRLKATG
ncbi:baseplate wedge subunit [Synechococcus phage S-RSM4]|uniref:Baseplate wedge subunit n=1 Tax=Synechococcus phage S-RSM4 TaxID=555387 RepID=C7BVK3_9CAUD|nr:baseplate wedge subunit [Synechococcus phage S-RSM4]CAR63432.1 baseplate wedge subunit [Synechococcus phage S-RSM4]